MSTSIYNSYVVPNQLGAGAGIPGVPGQGYAIGNPQVLANGQGLRISNVNIAQSQGVLGLQGSRIVTAPVVTDQRVQAAVVADWSYYTNVFKVVLLNLVPFGLMFWINFWCAKTFMASNDSGSLMVFELISGFGAIFGALFSGYYVRRSGNARFTVMIGFILHAPFMFCVWRCCTDKATANAAASWYWTLVISGAIAMIGCGMVLAGQLAYIAKGYNMAGSPHTGKVFKVWALTFPLGMFVCWLFTLAIASNWIWILIGTVATVIVALAWLSLDVPGEPAKFREETGVWAALNVFIRFLAAFICTHGFQGLAQIEWWSLPSDSTGLQQQGTIAFWVSVFAIIGALIFFGFGFDGCNESAWKVWNVLAVCVALFTLLNLCGIASNLQIFSCVFANMVFYGGQVLFVSHMIHASGRNEASAAAAAITLCAIAGWITKIFDTMFMANEVVFWILTAVSLFVTTWIIRNKLPTMNLVSYGVLPTSERVAI